MDIGAWLRGLGLGQYEQVFRDADVDVTVLGDLTDRDLEKLGVSLGHRKRLLRAIGSLSEGAPDPIKPPVPPGAERRRLTVMFVDLVGSTELSSRLDPEELREVIRAYQNAVAGEIARFEGHVAKFMGDGVLAYFGWPRAHEDEAERAVRAGLGVAEAVGRLRISDGTALACRVGVATGIVVVGDLIGAGEARERTVVGETPNLAARLQALARPGEAVIADATRRLVDGLFELADLGRRDLKGFAAPQPAFCVVRERPAETRFEARHEDHALAPMVGRDGELALLADAWARAMAGAGSVVLLAGDAGIGKSRLVQGLQRRLRDRRHGWLRYQCSPFHSSTALWPVVEQLTRAAGLQAEDEPPLRLHRLRSLLSQAVADPDTHLPHLAQLLGLAGETDAMARLAPAERKRRLLRALQAQLEGLASQSPLLLVVEDAHWIDPTTSELFELIFAAIATKPVLAVVTFRPDYDPPWRGLAHAAELTLSPLGPADAGTIVTQVAPGLPAELVQGIVDRADGVPLFIEEVARALAEAAPADARPDQLTVPASLHDTLMARLDRLGGARRVAQIGAAIGRAFTASLLARCTDLPADRLSAALADLVASGLVSRRGSGGDAVYLFKHALVQDAAYESLLRSQRREIHGRIADALAGARDAAPELLAHHLTAAGRTEAAIKAWRQAARRAVSRSANREATHHLDRALELLGALPDSSECKRTELALHLERAVALIADHGFGSDQVAACAARARALAERIGDEAQRFAALRLAWNSTLMREPLPRAVALAQELMRLAEAAGDPARLAVAHRALGFSLCVSGRQREALAVLDRGMALADGVGEAAFTVYGEHPGIVCRSYAAWSLALAGDVAASQARGDEAVAMARRSGNPHGLAWALVCAGVPALFTSDPERARMLHSEALAIAEGYRLPQWVGYASNALGWALFAGGDTERGLAAITRGLETVRATGAVLHTSRLLWTRARCLLASGDVAGAAADVEAALAHADSHDEGLVLPALLLLAGEVARARHEDPAPLWRRGIEVAEQQGSVLWLGRLKQSLAGISGRAGTPGSG